MLGCSIIHVAEFPTDFKSCSIINRIRRIDHPVPSDINNTQETTTTDVQKHCQPNTDTHQGTHPKRENEQNTKLTRTGSRNDITQIVSSLDNNGEMTCRTTTKPEHTQSLNITALPKEQIKPKTLSEAKQCESFDEFNLSDYLIERRKRNRMNHSNYVESLLSMFLPEDEELDI